MIVTNKNNVYGSNALAPQYKPSEEKKNELEKLKKEQLKVNKEKSIKSKLKVLRNIALTFIIGVTIIYRYSILYNLESEITNVESEMGMINAENEDLRVKLLKFDNINTIEKNGINMDMVQKSKAHSLYLDLDKNNFKETDKVETKKKDGFIDKIVSILF